MLMIAVDWNHDARFSHTRADVTAHTLSAEWLLGHPTPSEGVPPDGRLTVILDNADRAFSPDYVDGPLYGLIRPGRRVKVVIEDVIVWSGWLERIEVAVGRYGSRIATLIAMGSLGRLDQEAADLPPQTDLSPDAVVAAVVEDVIVSPTATALFQLDAAAFAALDDSTRLFDPTEHVDVTAAQTRLAIVGDMWTATTTPRDVIAQMAAAESGAVWQARDGTLIFRDRHFFLTDSAPTLVVDADSAANAARHRLAGWASVAQVTCYPRSSTPTPQIVWSSATPIELRGTSERVLTVNVDGVQQGVVALAPLVTGVDILAVDGVGRDVSGSVSASAVLVGGGLARITIRNTAGMTLWATLTLRGTIIYSGGAVTVEAVDPDRVIAVGRQVARYDLPVVDSIDTAEAYARWRLWRDRAPSAGLTHLSLRDRDAWWRANMLAWTIGTQLAIGEHQVGATDTYRIIGEAWTYSLSDGLAVTYTLFPADTNAYLITDRAATDSAAVGY